jgi:predicted dehydrogenase
MLDLEALAMLADNSHSGSQHQVLTRREFMSTTGLIGGAATAAVLGAAAMPWVTRAAHAGVESELKVGLIGCGGRGTGAVLDALEASPMTRIHAIGDVFLERVNGCREQWAGQDKAIAKRCVLPEDRVFVGFDAEDKVLASGVDLVILATPPGFRPRQLAKAIVAGKHVFMEKPVAVDPEGVRIVMAAARLAEEKKLNIVTGTQRRHEQCYLEALKRVRDGAIGKVMHASVYWNQGGLWMNPRKPEWSDLEWQLRNWLYFAWLSGDHIVEQHVHNIDVGQWFMEAYPDRCLAQGGRQVRTSPAYGHIFDHFAAEFEYDDGRTISSHCRQIDGCANRVEEIIHGTDGMARLSSGRAEIVGKASWVFRGDQPNPYVQEHRDLIAGITGEGAYLNEAERIAQTTLMAIMGRMSAYMGRSLTWAQAMESKLDLFPKTLAFGPMPMPEIAVPGQSPMV